MIKDYEKVDIMRINAYYLYMNFRDLEKIILADGWYLDGSTGSHRQYKHPVKSILAQAHIEVKK